MLYTETLKISLSSITANRSRSILTTLGVIIGVSAVILLVSIGSGIQQFVNEQFEQLGVNTITILPGKVSFGQGGGGVPSFSTSKLGTKEVLAVKKLPSIVSAAGGFQTFASIKNGAKSKYAEIHGVAPDFGNIYKVKIQEGRFVSSSDNAKGAKNIVIGASVVKELFGNRKALNKRVNLNGKAYTVIGTLKKSGGTGFADADAVAFIPEKTAKSQFGFKNYTMIVAEFSPNVKAKTATEEIQKALLKTLDKDEFTVMSREQILSSVSSIIGAITTALAGIAAVSLVVGGIGIMNIMLVSVTERTKEIGIRKAVGATPQNILVQFLTEAVVLSSFGGAIGIALGYLGSLLISRFIMTFVTFWSVALSFSFAMAVGIVFGIAPAIKAAKKDPIEALRYE